MSTFFSGMITQANVLYTAGRRPMTSGMFSWHFSWPECVLIQQKPDGILMVVGMSFEGFPCYQKQLTPTYAL